MADLGIFEPDNNPDRDSPIGDRAGRLGWSAAKVAGMLGLSARRVRLIAAEAPEIRCRPRATPTLAEGRRMLNDYLMDPDIRPAEFEAARERNARRVVS